MAVTSKPLTTRQAEILGLLNRGLTPKQVAQKLGVHENGIYQARRRLVAGGHLPKTRRASGRKQRTVRSVAKARPMASIVADGVVLDPVTVISRRIEVAREEIDGHSAQIIESTTALESLTDESKRLTKALKALTPSPNGSRKNTSARKRRAIPA